MKKILLACAVFFTCQSAFAKFQQKDTNNEIFAFPTKSNAYCVALKGSNTQVTLLTKYAIKKSELRKSMRSTTYLARVIGNIVITSILFFPVPLEYNANGIPVPTKEGVKNTFLNLAINTISNGVITSTFDDESMWIYGFLPYGLGERLMRGVRIKNLISTETHTINTNRFEKIIHILPSLDTTSIKCKFPANALSKSKEI